MKMIYNLMIENIQNEEKHFFFITSVSLNLLKAFDIV